MREIKFRGFTKDENGDKTIYIDGKKIKGRWVYGRYGYEQIDQGNIADTIQVFHEWDTRDGHYKQIEHVPVIPQTVGQWTGLNDKNGEEIYENNIVKNKIPFRRHAYTKENMYVSFDLIISGGINLRNIHCVTSDLNIVEYNDLEVIGNILENPELLESE